jgi:hypothetical protein
VKEKGRKSKDKGKIEVNRVKKNLKRGKNKRENGGQGVKPSISWQTENYFSRINGNGVLALLIIPISVRNFFG